MHSTEKYINGKMKFRIIGLVVIAIPFLLLSIKSIELFRSFSLPDIVLSLVHPAFSIFFIFNIIYTYKNYNKKIKEIGISKFEINEEDFIYIRNDNKQVFNTQTHLKSMRRNYKSFILITKEDEIINFLFADYGLEGEELEGEKVKFDLLKTNLLRS